MSLLFGILPLIVIVGLIIFLSYIILNDEEI